MITLFDIIIAIILIVAAVMGFRDGLLRQIVSWVGFIIGLILANRYSSHLSETIGHSHTLCYIGIVLAVPLVGAVLAWVVSKMLDMTIVLGLMNRTAGALLAIIKYALFLSFVVYLSSKVYTYPASVTETFSYGFLKTFGISFWNALS